MTLDKIEARTKISMITGRFVTCEAFPKSLWVPLNIDFRGTMRSCYHGKICPLESTRLLRETLGYKSIHEIFAKTTEIVHASLSDHLNSILRQIHLNSHSL